MTDAIIERTNSHLRTIAKSAAGGRGIGWSGNMSGEVTKGAIVAGLSIKDTPELSSILRFAFLEFLPIGQGEDGSSDATFDRGPLGL